jgi:DNA invertase Pin-like site-specific DNA recombinase
MRVIAYCRKSARHQRVQSIDRQRVAIQDFAAQHKARVVREYVEVEAGKGSGRPELAKALSDAKRLKATLIIASLDRLSRDCAFLLALLEAEVDFRSVR